VRAAANPELVERTCGSRPNRERITSMPAPNFFIVGAPKSGTTSLSRYLGQHPDVLMADPKEPFHFGRDLQSKPTWHIRDIERYLSLFETANSKRRIGEATVWYMYSKQAAHEICQFCPDAKIIMMLRNPVDTIYSLHSHYLSNGNEDIRDFATAVSLDLYRSRGDRLPKAAHFPQGLIYREVVNYPHQIRRYLRYFSSQNILVIIFEDFAKHPEVTYQTCLSFLDVDPGFTPDFSVHNSGKVVRSILLTRFLNHPPRLARIVPSSIYAAADWRLRRWNTRAGKRSPMSPALRCQLSAEFLPMIEDTENLINRDLEVWKVAPEIRGRSRPNARGA
jgi:hypothetical protein